MLIFASAVVLVKLRSSQLHIFYDLAIPHRIPDTSGVGLCHRPLVSSRVSKMVHSLIESKVLIKY